MQRLLTRLLMAMAGVAVVSLLLVPLTQRIAAERIFRSLPADVREASPFNSDFDPRAIFPELSDQQVEQIRASVSRFRREQQRSLTVALLVSLSVAAVLAVVFAPSIARPIDRVSRAAERLARGDFSARVAIPPRASPRSETTLLAQHFNEMAEALERFERERRAMIAEIAHELRTPLTAMRFRLDTLADGVAPLTVEEIERVRAQTDLLARLIDDLRTLSLADAGHLKLDLGPLDLGALVQRVLATHQARAAARDVRLDVELGDAPARVRGDADRLTQLLGNLIENALNAVPDGGWVRVELEPRGDHVRLQVADSGRGIPDDELDTIFERFVQGRDTRDTRGSGLGLAVVRTLVELHGGWIRARNADDAGAVFEVGLPVAQA